MSISKDFAMKSVQAAVSAIEIYNKPNFSYREEAFSLLMMNAWELLIKGKWLLDHSEDLGSLYELVKDATGAKIPKTNRSGNPLSFSGTYLAAKLLEDPKSGLEKACYSNILALTEIRDNAAHFLNKDLYLGRRVLEIGTASLRNYLCLATEWFQIDLTTYNFFLMPISFYHGFETAEPATRAHYPHQVQKLLAYLDSLEAQSGTAEGRQNMSLRLETKLSRGKDVTSVAFRWTDDPTAPAISLREDDVLKSFSWTYQDLVKAMDRRYSNFLMNDKFHRIRKPLETDKKYVVVRFLNPAKPSSSRQKFYNPNILPQFDKHYKLRTKT